MKAALQTKITFIRFFCFFLLFSFSSLLSFADVVVTPANSGSPVSADKAANAVLPSYTTLGDFIITETSNTDFSTGAVQTLILTAPAGWQFNPGVGSVSATLAADISNVSINVSATTITITFDINGTTGLDELTISGIQVQSVNGAIIPSAGQIYRSTANQGNAVIATILTSTNTDGSGGTNFGSLSQVAGAVTQLAFNIQPGSATVGIIFGQQPVIVTQDQFGTSTTTALATTENITVNLSFGTGLLSGTTVMNIGTGAGNGTISFTDLQINAAGIKKIMATAVSLASTETNAFTVSQTNTITTLSSDINPSCINGNVLLTATVTGFNVTGTVEFFDGITSLGISSVAGGIATFNTSALAAGVRSLTAIYSGDVNNNTSTSAIYSQTVNQKSADPTSATASATTICNGGNTTLTLNGGGGGTGEIIRWYTTSCGVGFIGTGNNLSVSPTSTTTYYGRYEDGAPCNYNSLCSQVTITVNQKSADPTSATASVTTICNGGTTTLTLNGGGGGTGPVIKWYAGSCGGTAAGAGNNIVVGPTTTTTYYGRYENAAPCNYNTACASVTITVNQRPTGNITSPNTAICNGSSTNITGNVTATGNWSLTLSNGSTATGTGNGTFSITVSPVVNTTYTITALTDAVCVSTAADRTGSTTVSVRTPIANAGINQTICVGGSTVIGGTTPASGSTGPYTYSWSPATGLNSASIANPTATPVSFPVTYSLIVTDAFGCNSAPSSTTISSGAVTKNWIGSGSIVNSGPDNNFNNPFNWSPAGVPGSCNDVVMTLLGSATISLTADATINSLNLNGIGGTDNLNVAANTLTINNATSITSTIGIIRIGVNDASSAGVIDFKGDVTAGTGVGQALFTGNVNSRLLFRKNLTMGAVANVATGGSVPGSAEFIGTGSQTITWNSSTALSLTARFNNVIIGDGTNAVLVTLAGSQKVDNILGNLTINNAATLDINTNQWNRNSNGGTFRMNGTATLKLAAASSAQTGLIFVNLAGIVVAGSNFPGGFTYILSSGSTVEYNGVVAQTIYSTPVYGNLTVTNNSIKTAGAPLTAAGNLLINPNATFKANGATGWTHNIGGNWTNNGIFTYVAGTTNIINFNGNNNASISGSSVTNFHSVTVNKGTSISTILDVLSTATTAASPAVLNFNNGLLRIQPTGVFTHNGAGPTIAATSGLHINGGTSNLTNGTITNNGLIKTTSGTGNFGTIAGNSINTATGGTFDMQGGTVNIAGRLVNTAGTLNISGGNMTLATVGNGSITGTLDMSLTTNMTVSGGNVYFQNANVAGNDIQIVNSSGIKIFTGGLFQIGNGSTPASNIFKITSAIPLYDLTVNNTNSPTARLITTALAVKNNLSISGGTLDAATNNLNISVGGNWMNNGNFLPGTATVTFNGSAAESISGSTNTNFYNLTNNNTTALLSVNNDISVTKQLSFSTGATMNLNTGNVTLRSDATNTANVGQINTNNAITYGTGKFIVERYIPNHSKAWQFLSVPTSGQTVNQAWQEGNAPLGNLKPGYGTIITSSVAGAVALGFDIYTPVAATIKIYDSPTNGWTSIPSPSVPIANPKGYMLLVRGDRSVTAFNQLATATTLRTTGKLYTPGTDAPVSTNVSSATFESIGNPYASAIDYSLVTKTGGVQTDIFYLWDPKLTTTVGPGINSAYGLGGYQTFSWNGITYDVTPGGGSYSGANRNIESGQAFFVHAPFSAGTVSFTEASKVTGSNIVNRIPNVMSKQLRTNLYVLSGGDNVLIDGNLVQFDENYSNNIDIEDGTKLNNTGENLGISRNNNILAVERRSIIETRDTIFYKMGQVRVQQYQFEFIPNNIGQPGLTAFLEDNYLHTSKVVELNDTTSISFAVENVAGSYDQNRFRLVFQQLRPVPVTFTNISANRNSDKSISINWRVENETSMQLYSVERSEDGRNFSGILTNNPTANNGGSASYQNVDLSPLTKDNFYRIKGKGISGMLQYSNSVRVAPIKSGQGIFVYPNPVTGKTFQLQFINEQFGKYNIALINSNGTKQQLKAVEINSIENTQTVILPQVLASGIYSLQIIGPDGTRIMKVINVLNGE